MCLRFDFIGKPTTQPSVLLNEFSCGTARAEVNHGDFTTASWEMIVGKEIHVKLGLFPI